MIDRSHQDQIWKKPSKYQEYGECTAQKPLQNLCKYIHWVLEDETLFITESSYYQYRKTLKKVTSSSFKTIYCKTKIVRMWVNDTISVCLLKRNHWPNLKILVKILINFSCLSYLLGTHRTKEYCKRTVIMPTFEKVKEEICNYRSGILLLNFVKLTGIIWDYQ